MSDKQINDNDWDPLDPMTVKNQRETYDDLRERCPVAHSEFMGWSLFRHDDIAAVLADPKTYSNVSRFLAIPNGMDPPVHAAYREALNIPLEIAINFFTNHTTQDTPRQRHCYLTAASIFPPVV